MLSVGHRFCGLLAQGHAQFAHGQNKDGGTGEANDKSKTFLKLLQNKKHQTFVGML